MNPLQCSARDHVLMVALIAVLSIAIGGALEYREIQAKNVISAPLGQDLKGPKKNSSTEWSQLLLNRADVMKIR